METVLPTTALTRAFDIHSLSLCWTNSLGSMVNSCDSCWIHWKLHHQNRSGKHQPPPLGPPYFGKPLTGFLLALPNSWQIGSSVPVCVLPLKTATHKHTKSGNNAFMSCIKHVRKRFGKVPKHNQTHEISCPSAHHNCALTLVLFPIHFEDLHFPVHAVLLVRLLSLFVSPFGCLSLLGCLCGHVFFTFFPGFADHLLVTFFSGFNSPTSTSKLPRSNS